MLKTSTTSSKSTSSKTSSNNSSPCSTRHNSQLSLSDILAEAQLEKLQGVEVLLQDTKYLDLLCKKAEDYEEFPALLYRFFYVHDKTHYLLRWALEKDINSLSPNELFRGETMATRLFYYQFFGELGKRFVTAILSTVMEEFSTLDHTVEIEPSRIPTPTTVSAQANLKWILEKLTAFVESLLEAVDTCPLGLRESFLFLKDVVGAKVENSNVFIASVLFLRLIGPCLVSPEEYGVIPNNTLTEHGRRGLILASKILQSAANNYLWEQDRAGSDLVNQFIMKSNPLIVQFATKLIDQETITLGRKVIKASVIPVGQMEIDLCHASLKRFISVHVYQKKLKSDIDYEQKYKLAMSMYQSKEWKNCYQAKKQDCEYAVCQLKTEGSNLVAFRYSGRFKNKYELVRDYIKQNPEMTIDERVAMNVVVEKHSENHFDTYWTLKAQFPVSARDFVYTSHQSEESPNRWMQLTYSIDREDKPVMKNNMIRGDINVMFFSVERDADPEYTLYTYIFHMDLKGWIPAFMINNNAKMSFNSLTKIAKKIMSLGKPEEVVQKKKKEDKKILKEKSNN